MSRKKKIERQPEANRRQQVLFTAGGVGLLAGGVGLWLLLAPTQVGTQPRSDHLAPSEVNADAWFEDVVEQSGIDFLHMSGRGGRLYMPEMMTGGVGLCDFDNDGLLDAYFVQGGYVIDKGKPQPTNKLYRNLGETTFEDITARSGTGDDGFGMGCACGDFDNDGFTDLYVTNVRRNVLYRNNGDATFTDVTAEAGVGDASFSASAAFLDYDRDGDLDLFVVNYFAWSPETEIDCMTDNGLPLYCKPSNYNAPARDTLYRNNGDGSFTDVTETAGIGVMFGDGLGVVCGDFTDDGWVDICVANDGSANQFWINQHDGTFRDEGVSSGIAFSGNGYPEAGMGIDARDVDYDLDADILMTHLEGETNTLYVRQDDYWEDQTTRFGLAGSRPFTGFGTGLIDLNNDGCLDNYVANGRIEAYRDRYATDDPYAEPNLLFAGKEGGGFAPVEPMGGTTQLLVHTSRGAAFGDIDNDGSIDILVSNHDARPYLLHNRVASSGNWILFDVRNRHGSPAIGAKVTVHIDGKPRAQEVRAAYSYCSSNDPRVHFGLGKSIKVTDVLVVWPDGRKRFYGGFAANAVVSLHP